MKASAGIMSPLNRGRPVWRELSPDLQILFPPTSIPFENPNSIALSLLFGSSEPRTVLAFLQQHLPFEQSF